MNDYYFGLFGWIGGRHYRMPSTNHYEMPWSLLVEDDVMCVLQVDMSRAGQLEQVILRLKGQERKYLEMLLELSVSPRC